MIVEPWVLWTVATLLATFVPVGTLLIIRSVDKVRPKKRCAKPLEYNPLVAGDGDLLISFEEAVVLARIIAEAQMRQRWGKDTSNIV